MLRMEIEQEYEWNTGQVIIETFAHRNIQPAAIAAALVNSHGPFAWGSDAAAAVHSAVVLEEVAYMALHTEQLRAELPPISQNLLDLHYLRKHGKNAWYGQ